MSLYDAAFIDRDLDWTGLLDALKPGAFLLTIGEGQWYRQTSAIEDAGFEIRDTCMCLTATGSFPVLLAMKPTEGTYVENALEYGVAGLNIKGSRVGSETVTTHSRGHNRAYPKRPGETTPEESGRKKRQDLVEANPRQGRFPSNLILQHHPDCECVGTKKVETGASGTKTGKKARGVAYGMFNGRSTVDYASEDGTETVPNWNCHHACPVGRLESQTAEKMHSAGHARKAVRGGDYDASSFNMGNPRQMNRFGDSGGASRFFYNATSDLDLRRYLAHLVLPPHREGDRMILTTGGILTEACDLAGWERVEVDL